LRQAHVGERLECALQIIARRQQRLGDIGVCAGDDADGAAARPFIQKLDRARRSLAGNFQSRNLIAQFDRQFETRLGFAIGRPESKLYFAERQSL
jgi:hypothetical protein